MNELVFAKEDISALENSFELESDVSDESATNLDFQSGQLMRLKQAARLFWRDTSVPDKDIHPKSKDVENWLIEKGFSTSLAKAGASITRPEWGVKGRR